MLAWCGARGGRLLAAAMLAAALCLVFATRVFVSFDGRRVKLVRAPVVAHNAQVRIDTSLDSRAALLDAPVAVIATVRNQGTHRQSVSIEADGRLLCAVEIAPATAQRVDCVADHGWTARGDHVIQIRGASSDWTLEYFELASHHGSSKGALRLVVLPDVATRYGRAGPVLIGCVWFLLTLVFALPAPARWPRPLAVVHHVASAIALVVLAIVITSPWFSPYLVVISAGAFANVAAVLSAPQLSHAVGGAWTLWLGWLKLHAQWRPVVAIAATVAVVSLAHALVIRSAAHEFGGQYSGLVRISEQHFNRVPFLRERSDLRSTLVLLPDDGYDAQFHYFAMFDPLMLRFREEPIRYRAVADAPPYRFGRIGFPWLARVIAGERPEGYPTVMVALVWLGTMLSALALAGLARQQGASPAWGLAVLGIPGFWVSTRVALPEPLAAALLLLGYWCVRSRHVAVATVLFAASLLIRETGMLFVLSVALLTRAAELPRRSRVALMCSLAPLVAWRTYVCGVLWPDWGWQGLFYSPQSLTVPLAGLLDLWSVLASGNYLPGSPEVVRAAIGYSAVLVCAAAVAFALAPRTTRVVGVALVAYALIALSLSYPVIWAHVGNAQRGSYELFVMLALASVQWRQYPRLLRGALAAVWIGAGAYLFYGSFDAASMRGALLPWG